MVNINEIKELVSQFDESSLTEFDLREGQFELYMNKNESSRGVSAPAPTVEVPNVVMAESAASSSTRPEISKKTTQETPKLFDGVEVTSPIVGIVYLQPAPDKPQFKSVGDKVAKGEVICIIEAMKLMNEITSEVDGQIVEILVENEAIVEYGQALFRIQPN